MSEVSFINPSGSGALFAYSPAVAANGFIFVSGQGALDSSNTVMFPDDAFEQTKATIARIALILESSGSSLDRVLSCTVFLSSLDHLSDFNAGWEEAFGDHRPARATVVAGLLLDGLVVEIQAVAVV